MERPTLRFHENGRFRILMVTDFHCGESYNPKLKTGFRALIKATEPDFVMLGGDQCVCRNTPKEADEYMRDIVEPITEKGLPWAATYGNHDRECGLDLDAEEAIYENIPGCLSQRGPKDIHGVSNYRIPVLASRSDEVAYDLWSIDSNHEVDDYIEEFGLKKGTQIILPHHFNDGENGGSPYFDQVMWYYKTSSDLEKERGHKTPGVLFSHIPVPEFYQILRNPEETEAIGSKRAPCGAAEINSGMFLASLERQEIRGMFFGHEHHIDMQGEYCGITLACASALGYNMSAHDDLRGGRVIDLFEDGNMETYHVKLMDLLGRDAMRDPDYFEGGCRYHIRVLG